MSEVRTTLRLDVETHRILKSACALAGERSLSRFVGKLAQRELDRLIIEQAIRSKSSSQSAILPIEEYQALLEAAAPEDETAFLLREPNGSLLLKCIDDINHGRNIVTREIEINED